MYNKYAQTIFNTFNASNETPVDFLLREGKVAEI